MKIRFIELEMDKDELRASSTLGDQASMFLKNLLRSINGEPGEIDEDEEERDNDE